MTIDELIERLEDARNDMGGDTEVHVAYQPGWPLAAHISYTACGDPNADPDEAEDDDDVAEDVRLARAASPAGARDAQAGWFWLAVDQDYEMPYGPRWAWDGEPA